MSENREPRAGSRTNVVSVLDPQVCYRALETRDERFDGRIFVGVTSTGIYCRPVCPAGRAKFENCLFFSSAAAAQEAGFRPCLRCRPETVVDLGSWRGTSNTVARGLALIAEGHLDGDDASIDELAERLGIGERQLRRLFHRHLGASPIAVAQTRRVLFAKQLIHETQLPMTQVADAAGFGSVRRFNEVFRELFQRPPSALRRQPSARSSNATSGVTVRLRYRAPYDFAAMIGFFRMRAVEGVERVEGDRYLRNIRLHGRSGTLEIAHVPRLESLSVTVRFPDVRALPVIVERVRRVFDLGADVVVIGRHLSRDALLASLIEKRPGLRVPAAWDGFELGVRAILGQQVSVEAARKLAGTLVRACHEARSAQAKLADPIVCFPDAAEVASVDLAVLKMPGARKKALRALAEAAIADPSLFHAQNTVEETVARLVAIDGIGEWTAMYIALRAAREPDAFPASDVGLLRGATPRNGTRPKPAELLARAEPWRPWRAYAAQHLWMAES